MAGRRLVSVTEVELPVTVTFLTPATPRPAMPCPLVCQNWTRYPRMGVLPEVIVKMKIIVSISVSSYHHRPGTRTLQPSWSSHPRQTQRWVAQEVLEGKKKI